MFGVSNFSESWEHSFSDKYKLCKLEGVNLAFPDFWASKVPRIHQNSVLAAHMQGFDSKENSVRKEDWEELIKGLSLVRRHKALSSIRCKDPGFSLVLNVPKILWTISRRLWG